MLQRKWDICANWLMFLPITSVIDDTFEHVMKYCRRKYLIYIIYNLPITSVIDDTFEQVMK